MKADTSLLRAQTREVDLGYVSPCWIWTRGVNGHGYPSAKIDGGWPVVSRVMYELSVGPIIPFTLVLDHLCHTADTECRGRCEHRLCINPAHLEPVTLAENVRRQHLRTHCPLGHEKSPKPGRPWLVCKVCDADRARARRRARSAAV